MNTSKFMLLVVGLLALNSAQAADPAARRPDVEQIAHACAGCHGTNGHSQTGIPSIAGIDEEAFVSKMQDYKSDKLPFSIMARIASGYTDEDFANLAHFFKGR
jgi:sulfide dehydrogenase cytochrome subunit